MSCQDNKYNTTEDYISTGHTGFVAKYAYITKLSNLSFTP